MKPVVLWAIIFPLVWIAFMTSLREGDYDSLTNLSIWVLAAVGLFILGFGMVIVWALTDRGEPR